MRDITGRKARFTRLYDLSTDERLVFHVHTKEEQSMSPGSVRDLSRKRELILRRYDQFVGHYENTDDDFIPYIDMITGTEIFAEAFGCEVFQSEGNMPFALPMVMNSEEAAKVKVPRLEDTPLYDLIDMASGLRVKLGADTLLSMVDVQAPMDIAALIWDKNDFYVAMAEEPERVIELAHKTGTLLTEFLDRWFEIFGKEYIAHYPDYYVPYGITLSEDEIGSVSEGMFAGMFLPELVNLSNRYNAIYIHCCANAKHQWRHFDKIPNLRLLNLIQPNKILKESFEYFKDKTSMLPAYGFSDDIIGDIKTMPQNAHMCFDFTVDTQEAANRLCDTLNAYRGS